MMRVSKLALSLFVATALFLVPYGVHVTQHYIESKHEWIVRRSESPPFGVVVVAPRAMYIGQPYSVHINFMPIYPDGSTFGFDKAFPTRENLVYYSYFERATKRAKCSLDGPDVTVIEIGLCEYLVSPKAAGRPLLVASIKNIGDVPYTGGVISEKVFIEMPVADLHIALNIPANSPLETAIPTVSTFLGILAAVVGLFFRQSGAAVAQATATERLLSDIAKKRQR